MPSELAPAWFSAAVQRIAHPTDLTESSDNALAWAIHLAQANDTELLLLHVVPPPTPIFEAESPFRTQAEYNLSVMLMKLKALDVVARVLLLTGTGSIDGQVLRAARLEGVDLIVMGTRSRSGISRFLMGSLASRVIARAHCPVLVLRGQSVNKNTSRRIPSMSDECQRETKLFA